MRKNKSLVSTINTKGILVNQDFLVLLQALAQVDKKYLSYADTNANADDRKDQINQLERVFAYELYHQWSLLKDDILVLNGEIDKLWNDKTWYPDLVLHGGQDDFENNKIVVEIKRECMVKGKPEAILDDLEKLSLFLEIVDKESEFRKYRNYELAVFILLKGDLNEISEALKNDKATKKVINDNVVCMSYNEKREIRISRLSDLKK